MVSGGTVQGDLSSFQSLCGKYDSEVAGLSGSWQGASYDNLSSKADACAEEFKNALNSQMDAFASACDLYVQYETCKQNLQISKNNYNTAVSNQDASAMTSYGNQVASFGSQLNQLKSQIEGLLASASSIHLEATPLSGVSSNSALGALGEPSYGSFQRMTYTAQNGKTVDYYLYIPDYGTDKVSGLPIMIYMHGSGETGAGTLKCGLPKLISEQGINPSGIVICLQAHSTSDFSNGAYEDAVVEMTNSVAAEYGGDLNKVSVSGHSMGAIAGYRLIGRYPEYFSAFVPISGVPSNTDSLSNVYTWAFHGSRDTSCDYSKTEYMVRKLKNAGYDISLHTFQGAGHGGVQNYTWTEEYEDEEGNSVNPLEWAFGKTKKSAQTTAV
ncbi:MAG: prolyl oligopeptidase family serine peptidase [Bacilli bacterium]|nr:prolyl oligopeptidase family serine peptidase [Bacilli bacterium]